MVLGLGKKKGSPLSVVYEIRLNEVKPWPCTKSPSQVVIQWQRGEKRSGSTRIVSCDRDRISINESFTVPATLYKLPNGRFHKKCVIFTLCDAQQRLRPLGRAVLDLADYASLDKSSNSSILVAVAKRELSALGTPYLSFTISPQGAASKPQEQLHQNLVSVEEGEEEEVIADFTDDDEDEAEYSLSVSSAPADSKQEQPRPPSPCAASTSSSIVDVTSTVQPNDRVQPVASTPKSVAALAAASAYASKRKPSFNAASLSNEHTTNVLQAARTKYAEGAAERGERLDKKAVEEARQRAAAAEAKAAAAVERTNQLEMEMENLKSELREAAALELALYSVVAQHGSSSHKIHAPARRLARIYLYTCNNSSDHQARAGTARACASGLVVVVRACENDVSRLTFWWSNVVVLREMISQAVDIPPSQGSDVNVLDWRETSTLSSTLERIEAWIFGRIVECIWWQSLTPHMQSSVSGDQNSVPTTPDKSVVSRLKKSVRGLMISDFVSSQQGNMSVEIWKSAFLDALQRICPVRAGGHDCGCIQVVTRMIVEQCVTRLDVAMFNAILRDIEENVPTDPISDPISELSVLPIAPDNVTFGGGAQLKNVINTWSTWLLTLTAEGGGEGAAAAAQENVEKGRSHFTLLRAMSDLLMLPKDMLMDKTVRKEVCPALSLLLIRRVLSKFVPDEFAPDPVPPSLLAALNAEISMERQRVGEEDISPTTVIMASAPPVVYFPPSSTLIHETFSPRGAARTRKGNTSDDELEELESPLALLFDNGCLDSKAGPQLQTCLAKRYRLLRQIWNKF